MAIDLDEVRRRILIALFSDDELMDVLVFKGGNALAMIHKVGSRASLDMDFSIPATFPDLGQTKGRIFDCLRREFGSIGYVLFDERCEIRPSRLVGQPEWWGGYRVEFKLIERALYDELREDINAVRRQAAELGPAHKTKYGIDISGYEFCTGKEQKEVDDYIVYVYSLAMIAAEKLRAICQQMPEYPFCLRKRPRARDFYDIHEIVARNGVILSTEPNLSSLRAIFAVKEVPLELLGKIHQHRGFHELDWPELKTTVSGPLGTYDSYFDFVTELASELLEALRIK